MILIGNSQKPGELENAHTETRLAYFTRKSGINSDASEGEHAISASCQTPTMRLDEGHTVDRGR